MASALFRPEAIEAQRHRLSGAVMAAVPPSSRLYTAIAAGFAVVILAVLLLGSYAGASNVRGIVTFDEGLARVNSPANGDVRQILVRPGQQVEAGTPLLVISTAPGPTGLATQLIQIDRQIAEIDAQTGIGAASLQADTAALRSQRAGLLASIGSLARQQAISRGQVALAGQDVGRYTRLARQNAATQRQVNQARAEMLNRRAEAEALGERLIDARSKAAGLAAQIAQRTLEAERTRSTLAAQRAALVSQRDEIVRADHAVLVAPVAGEVSDVAVTIGQHVGAERALVTVVPRGSRLEGWLYASSNAIGFAHPGQAVRLRFDAFPYQKYGLGRGTVVEVSRAPIDPASVDAAVRPAEPSFRVRVRVDTLGAHIPPAGLRPGMTLNADLVQRRHPLWSLVVGQVTGAVTP